MTTATLKRPTATAKLALNDLLARNESLTIDDLLTAASTSALAAIAALEAQWHNAIRRRNGSRTGAERREWHARMVAAREAMLSARWSAATAF